MDLAELKLNIMGDFYAGIGVLIGPCGIETSYWKNWASKHKAVLIGPCGIETGMSANSMSLDWVLIGPCGIETCIARL